ncbi:MAG: toprim domain-containing protein [Rhodanobacteraceae bacterium]
MICEGMATGFSIHEATGHATACAMSCMNLEAVAVVLHRRYADVRITMCADRDEVGLQHAHAAARLVGGRVAIPPEPHIDFNDMAVAEAEDRAR